MRESLRCAHCLMVQFRTATERCRRCRKPYVAPPVEPRQEPKPVIAIPPREPQAYEEINFGAILKSIRAARGLGQRELALLLGCPRTWISKLENGRAKPTMQSLYRIATALEISVSALLDGRHHVEPDLLSDPFTVELLPYVKHLDAISRHCVIEAVREMASGRRMIA